MRQRGCSVDNPSGQRRLVPMVKGRRELPARYDPSAPAIDTEMSSASTGENQFMWSCSDAVYATCAIPVTMSMCFTGESTSRAAVPLT